MNKIQLTKKIILFWSKIAIYLSLAFLKDVQLQEKPSAVKREHPALQKIKFINFFYFVVHFALLDPDPEPQQWQHCTYLTVKYCRYQYGIPSLQKQWTSVVVLWIRTRLDRHHFGPSPDTFQPNVNLNCTFSQSKILKIMKLWRWRERKKQCKLSLLWIKVKTLFPTCVNLWVFGSESGSGLAWQMEIRIRIGIKMKPIYKPG